MILIQLRLRLRNKKALLRVPYVITIDIVLTFTGTLEGDVSAETLDPR